MELPFIGGSRTSSVEGGMFAYIFGGSNNFKYSIGYTFVPKTIKSVKITDDTRVYSMAFHNCDWIESIEINEGVTSISSQAFYNCSGITHFVIPETVTDIGYQAFYNCTGLEGIIIPDSVTKIQHEAFYGCTSLAELTVLDKICSIYDSSNTINAKTIIKAPCGSTAYDYAKKYNRSFVSTEHTLTEWLADFTVNGETMTTSVYKKCTICDEVVDLTTHKTNGWVIDTEPSCEVEGSKHIECIDCGNIYDAIIPATGHSEVVDESISATCTTTGLTEGKHCSICNTVIIEQTTTDKLGHNMGDWVETITATCTQAGEKRKDCSRCDYYEVDNISMLPHTEVIDKAVAATCTTTGLTEGKHCSLCNSVIIEQEIINVTNHNYKDGICTMCGSKQTEGCNCNCHKSGITSLFFKLILFFQKIFKSNKLCKCGISHY